MLSWTKERWVGRDLELQREGRQFIGRRKEQMFGKQMFAGLCRNSGTQREITGFAIFHLPHLVYITLQLSMVIAAFLDHVLHLHFLGQLGEG